MWLKDTVEQNTAGKARESSSTLIDVGYVVILLYFLTKSRKVCCPKFQTTLGTNCVHAGSATSLCAPIFLHITQTYDANLVDSK